MDPGRFPKALTDLAQVCGGFLSGIVSNARTAFMILFVVSFAVSGDNK